MPPLPKRIWWPWDEPAERVAFYRAFKVQEAAHATLYVSASGPYAIWLDDRWLSVPDTPLPSWRAMHRYSIDLTPGVHALNVLATSGEHGQPFLLACLDWVQEGRSMRVGTDQEWHAVVDPPLEWMPPIPDGAQIPPEIVAPEEDPADAESAADLFDQVDAWRSAFPPGIDFRLWDEAPEVEIESEPPSPHRGYTSGSLLQDGRAAAFEYKAWAFDGVWSEPWGMPCNAPDDFCRLSTDWQVVSEEQLSRVTALHQGLTAAGTGVRVYTDDTLQMRPVAPFPAQPPRIENTRPRDMWHQVREVHSQRINSWLDQYEARSPHAVLDAGRETFARVRVQLQSGGPAILALTTAESVSEIHRYDRRISDVFELKDGETFVTSPSGFRYVKLMVLSARGGTVRLEPIQVQHIRHPIEAVGSFACSDPLLDQVWAVSAHTLHLCMQNEIWDATKRDQLPWMGDLSISALAAYHVFGDARLVRRSLAVLSELGPAPARPLERQIYPGLSAAWRPAGGELNGVPPYIMWWVVSLADYVRYTGDRTLVQEYESELIAALLHISRHVGRDGLWHWSKRGRQEEWAPLDARECEMCCHLVAILATGLCTDLLASLGRLDVAEYSSALRLRMVEAVRLAWLDKDLTDLETNPSGGENWSNHVYAMAIRSGCLSPEEKATLFRRIVESERSFPMTYWHRFSDLDAAAQAGEAEWGLDYVRAHWGSALKAGMTTLWETFDPAWLGNDPHGVSIVTGESGTYGGYRTSHCHSCSAGPATWLHTTILGVTPVRAGFAAIRFEPALGDLLWAEGTIPTPLGPIHVSLRHNEQERSSAQLTVPHGMTVHIQESTRQAWEIEIVPDETRENQPQATADDPSSYATGKKRSPL